MKFLYFITLLFLVLSVLVKAEDAEIEDNASRYVMPATVTNASKTIPNTNNYNKSTTVTLTGKSIPKTEIYNTRTKVPINAIRRVRTETHLPKGYKIAFEKVHCVYLGGKIPVDCDTLDHEVSGMTAFGIYTQKYTDYYDCDYYTENESTKYDTAKCSTYSYDSEAQTFAINNKDYFTLIEKFNPSIPYTTCKTLSSKSQCTVSYRGGYETITIYPEKDAKTISTTSTKVIPNITTTTTTTKTKTIPTSTSTTSTKTIPTSTSTTSTKTIPTSTSTTSTKTIPTSTSTTSTKTIPTSTSTTSTKTIPTSTSTTSTKTIPTSTSTTSTKTIPTSTTTSTKTIPTSTSTTSTKTIPTSTSTTSTKTIPTSTSTTSTKTIPTSTTTTSTKTIPTSTKCLPITVTVTQKEKITVTIRETVTVTKTRQAEPTGDNCAAKWAQCGGVGFNGPTCCQSGSTCHQVNQYYSQCI